MGMCHTKEVKARARETNLKKYGYGIGARHYLKIQNRTVWDLPEVSEEFTLFE